PAAASSVPPELSVTPVPATLPVAASARLLPAVVVSVVAPVPPATAPPTFSAAAFVRLKPFALNAPRFAIALLPPSVVVPVELPVSVPAVIAPLAAACVIAPLDVSVAVPVPAFNAPSSVNAPPLKPSAPLLLFTLLPAAASSVPPELSVTPVPATLPVAASVRLLPAVVVSVVDPVPPATAPLTFSAAAFVRLKPFVALNAPSVPIRLASFRLALPAALPASVFA